MLRTIFFRFPPLLLALALACAPFLGGCKGFTPRPAATRPAEQEDYTGNSRSYYYYTAALILGEEGNLPQAAEAMKKAIHADPQSLHLKSELAKLYLEMDEVDKARPLCMEVVAATPDDPKVYLLLGAIEGMAGKDAEAISAYQKALELDPAREDVAFVLGELYYRSERFDEAVSLYRQIIDKDPQSFQSWFFLGEALARQDKPDEAVAAFTKAAEINPELDQARFEIIRIYMEEGRNEDVVRTFHELMEQGPMLRLKAILGLAAYYLQEKDLPRARETLDLLTPEQKQEPELAQQVGKIYLENQYYSEAEEVFDSLVRQGDTSGIMYYLLALSREAGGKKEEAVATYRKVPADSASYSSALLRIAQLTKERADLEAAFKEISDNLDRGTATSENISIIASLMSDRDMLEKAQKLLDLALAKAPADPSLLFALGVVQDKKGEKLACIETMKKVLAITPDDPVPLNYLGYTYADMGIELDKAEILVQKALSFRPEDGFIMDSLAWVYFKKGETDKALALLERSVSIVPDEPVILEHLGDAYLQSGQKEKALSAYQKALPFQKDPAMKKALEEKISELAQ